ncbi:stage VI sporulation protein D [Fictibacillus solisalsi]|uniref:Stage VI sporulation protein D n=1 Tax=Fictibacillus solisalsi TaxID=459525 RepID=A0A1G9WTH9_9BACL|nr:LysM peptidoglycan-binding domain-containing protein [Fictibacillus solisalsi]SDM87571.1 stage VI sporulation protein D [Fictibacillus solisalsi]
MNPSKLRFSIEESVWLKKGQEVAEVLSMAMEPEIQVTEENGQVCVKGALKLHGEYRPCVLDEGGSLNLETGSLREQVSYRSLTQLKMNDEGIAELDHRFPVDITIPSSRVPRLEEVFILVDAFDYELPNPTCLELTASVSISGILDSNEEAGEREEEEFSEQPVEETFESFTSNDEEEAFESFTSNDEEEAFESFTSNDEEEAVEAFEIPAFEARYENEQPEEQEEETPRDAEEEIFAPFSFESKKHFEMPVPDQPEVDDFLEPAIYYNRQDDDYSSLAEEPAMKTEEEQGEEAEEETAFPALKSISYYTPSYTPPVPPVPAFQQEETVTVEDSWADTDSHDYAQIEEQRPDTDSHDYAQIEEQRPDTDSHDYAQIEEQRPETYSPFSYAQTEDVVTGENAEHVYEEEPEEAEHTAPSRKEENALYLTKMLSGNEEKFSKVKMYIIQRGESLDSICERYDVSIHSLLRVNRINQEEVNEGQIIYIPFSHSR